MRSLSKKDVSVADLAALVRRRMQGSEDDEQVRALCLDAVLEQLGDAVPDLTAARRLTRLVFCSLRCELEILQDLADDPAVTEIMVNGCEAVFIEREGRIGRADVCFETPEQLEQVIRRLAARVGREMNDLNPIVDARLADGSRINAVHANVALNGPILTIRKFCRTRMQMEDLIARGDISREAADLLKTLVESGYNIFVSGGTSSGKTTFLNVLSDYIPPQERIIVIEDAAELAIRGHENLVRMEAKRPNSQGKGAVTIRDLIKTSLRMRPDRLIVGETRGDEVIDMLAAMSTGHDGSLSTGHANSTAGMLSRLETLHIAASGFPMRAVRSQIAQSIEILVHMQRFAGGHRRVTEIAEIAGMAGDEIRLNRLFVYDVENGLIPTGSALQNTAKIALHRARVADAAQEA